MRIYHRLRPQNVVEKKPTGIPLTLSLDMVKKSNFNQCVSLHGDGPTERSVRAEVGVNFDAAIFPTANVSRAENNRSLCFLANFGANCTRS